MNVTWKRMGIIIPVALIVITLCSVTAMSLNPTVVVQQYSINPDSFMPGDAGTVTIIIRNSAIVTPLAEGTSSEQTSETQGATDSHTQSSGGFYTTGSTQNTTTEQDTLSTSEQSTFYLPMDVNISSAKLEGTPQFTVESPAYENIGRIGPGDTVSFTFVVRASQDITDGIYFMVFALETDNPNVYINYQVPLKVDTSMLRLIISSQPKVLGSSTSDFVFDVVNIRNNDVSMVYIESGGDSLSFSPVEYYIGAMDSGEMFTAQMQVSSDGTDSQQVTASFQLHFKNGDNWHNSEVLDITIDMEPADETGDMELPLPGLLAVVAVLLLAISYYAFRRSKRKK